MRQIRAALDRKEDPRPCDRCRNVQGTGRRVAGRKPLAAQGTHDDASAALISPPAPRSSARSSVTEVRPADVLAVLRTLEKRGVYETAKRTRIYCAALFDYAMAIGLSRSESGCAAEGEGRSAPTARR